MDEKSNTRMRAAAAEPATRPVQTKPKQAVDFGYGDLVAAARGQLDRIPRKGAEGAGGVATASAPIALQSSGIIQRQPQPPPTPAFTQTDYTAAVALLSSRNPAVHSILQQGVVGSSVRVRKHHFPIAGATTGSPTAVDIFFDLIITAGGATPGARAQFGLESAIRNMTPPTATITQRLPFTVNAPPPGAANPTSTLAEYLLHEGLHMLLQMDRLMNRYAQGAPGTQSGTMPSFQAYKTRAQASSNYLPLFVDMSTVIGAFFTTHPGTPGAPTTPSEYDQIAGTVFDRIVEERFAVDQQRQQFPAGVAAGATNGGISLGYMRRYLADEGVIIPVGDTNVPRLINEMTAVLNDIPFAFGVTPPATPPASSTSPTPPASSTPPTPPASSTPPSPPASSTPSRPPPAP